MSTNDCVIAIIVLVALFLFKPSRARPPSLTGARASRGNINFCSESRAVLYHENITPSKGIQQECHPHSFGNGQNGVRVANGDAGIWVHM